MKFIKYIYLAIILSIFTGCVGFTPPPSSKYEISTIKESHYYIGSEKYYWKNFPKTANGKHTIESRRQWCGITIWAVVPIPVKLPLCRSYTEVEFANGMPVTSIEKSYEGSRSYTCGPGTLFLTGLDEKGSGSHFCGSYY